MEFAEIEIEHHVIGSIFAVLACFLFFIFRNYKLIINRIVFVSINVLGRLGILISLIFNRS